MIRTLANAAAELKRHAPAGRAGKPRRHNLPSLWFMTDEARLPDPTAVIARLSPGTAVIFRHYRDKHRAQLALRLAALCRRRRLIFLVAGDWRLAARVGAAGLHLPEYMARRGATAGARLWRRNRGRLLTAAARSKLQLHRARQLKVSAVLVSPVFPTPSHPERRPLGVTRCAGMARETCLPMIALGGVTAGTVRRLRETGCAAVAGIGFALGD